MDTRNFNLIDKLVAGMRLGKVLGHVREGDRVLDFGCGSQGYLLRKVSDRIKSGVGLDYDVDDEKIENLEFRKFSFKDKFDFKSASFDKVVMLAVLEHIELNKVEVLFKEFARVLSKGGKVVLTTPTPMSKAILELLAYKLHVISEGEIRDHKKYYRKEDMLMLAKKAGFKLESYNLFQFGINSVAVFKKV